MTDRTQSLAVKPIIHYPREAQVGKTYLMTIDLQPEEGFEWQYEEEEYPIYCKVDSELFSSKPVGEPVVVLHRFGGSYGEAKFLLTAAIQAQQGKIVVRFINKYGVLFKTLTLENLFLVAEIDYFPLILPNIEIASTISSPKLSTDLSKLIAEQIKYIPEIIPNVQIPLTIPLVRSSGNSSRLIAENLQSDPTASVEILVERLQSDERLLQFYPLFRAFGLQMLVDNGGIADVGVHLHDFDEDKLEKVLKAFYQSLESVEIPNNVPRSGVAKFIGCEPELEQLHTYLQQSNLISLLALEGMAGVGKTELVIQYIHKYSSLYEGGICWLFAREFNIGTQIVGFAQSQLNLKVPEGLELPDQVAFCWRNWRMGDVLLVLDDVVNYPRDVEPYLPPAAFTRFRVVMTTRQKFGPPIQSLSLEILSLEESLALLTILIGEDRVQSELEIAKTLCNWLEHLPLGVELVGRYLLQRTELSLSTLLFRLQEKAERRQSITHAALKVNETINTATCKRGAEAAFDLSWEELDDRSQHLGKLLSLFAAAPIPWHLVESIERKYCEESDDRKKFDSEEIEKARANLIDLYLLKILDYEKQIYRLHSMIREFFRSKFDNQADIINITPKKINTQRALHILSLSTRSIQDSLQLKLENVLCNREVKSAEIYNDDNQAMIQSVEDIESCDIYSEQIECYEPQQIAIPFKACVGCLLSYFISKADYYSLDDERNISIDDRNDHYFSAEEYHLLEVEGVAVIDLNIIDGFEDSILSDEEISDFLSDVDISVPQTSKIEVL
jgi:NB-ARC domain